MVKEFHSITYGDLSIADVLFHLADFASSENPKGYRIIIGTDSNGHNSGGKTEYITAIIVHRVGGGGIYFWKKATERKAFSLRERIYREAIISLDFASELIKDLAKYNLLTWPFEIHVDVGNMGETREIINEVVGMIRGSGLASMYRSGFEVKTKPNSFGASKVADRYT